MGCCVGREAAGSGGIGLRARARRSGGGASRRCRLRVELAGGGKIRVDVDLGRRVQDLQQQQDVRVGRQREAVAPPLAIVVEQPLEVGAASGLAPQLHHLLLDVGKAFEAAALGPVGCERFPQAAPAR